MEPKKLYWAKEEVDLTESQPGIGTAVVRRDGADATLIAYGPAVPVALEAAEVAAAEGRQLRWWICGRWCRSTTRRCARRYGVPDGLL